jgi:outer membrane protein OmpA-like peptidoglycan-associated protein
MNSRLLTRRAFSIGVASIALSLAACQSAPEPKLDTRARLAKLKSMGFELSEEGFYLNLRGPLLFETGSDVLGEDAKKTIDQLALDLLGLDINHLKLYGHTDNVGTADYNRALSSKRAEAVAREIASKGFDLNHIVRRGFGFVHPVATNDTPEGRAQNRRVTVIVPNE